MKLVSSARPPKPVKDAIEARAKQAAIDRQAPLLFP
jgi:hypothetical protein